MLIPDEAVLSDQGRKYVYIDNDKDEVAYKTVTLGQEIKGQRVIKTGLNKDDRVIVDGLQRIRPGVRVTAEVRPAAQPPESPLKKLLDSAPKAQAPAATKKPAQGHPAERSGPAKQADAKNSK